MQEPTSGTLANVNSILEKLSEEEKEVLQNYFTAAIPLKRSRTQFSYEEDQRLKNLVEQYGENDWNTISSHMEGRNIRQCRERWRHYLSPTIKNTPWTPEEDELLRQKVTQYGPRWVLLTAYFPNRTDVNIKNRWVVLLRRQASENTQKSQKIATIPIVKENFDIFDDFVIDDCSVAA